MANMTADQIEAAERVVKHWDGACDDHPDYREWDFTEAIDNLREKLGMAPWR